MADTLTDIPRIMPVDETCGCSLTNANITGMTPATLAAQGYTEQSIAEQIVTATEAKAIGVQERGLDLLLKSNIREVGKKDLNRVKIGKQSYVLPYIMRPQRNIINNNFWSLIGGNVHPDAGTGDIPASAYQLTVGLNGSPWQPTLQQIERYFLTDMYLYVFAWNNTTDKTALTLSYRIIGAQNADAGPASRALVSVVPNVTDATWAGMTAAERAVYQPTYGQAIIGPNNVDDRESWCQEMPVELNKHLLVNWLQTVRKSICVNKEMKRLLNLIMSGKVNEYLRAFRYLDLTEQNKQKERLFNKALMHAAFFGDVINENQTPETYASLPTIDDPYFADCQHGYKANALGIRTILNNNNRVLDMNGAAMDLDTLFANLDVVNRHRQATGTDVETIDMMCGRTLYKNIMELMSRYYQLKFNSTLERRAELNQKLTFDKRVLFNYTVYDLPDQGVRLGVFAEPFFDDFSRSFLDDQGTTPAGFSSRGNMAMLLDWSDIAFGAGPTNFAEHKFPDPNAIPAEWTCVIEKNWNEYSLRSQMFTMFVDRPMRHLSFENFNNDCPTLNVTPCTPSTSEEEESES